MGTNYYLRWPDERCASCGHIKDGRRVHVGKSSIGWHFCFEATMHKGPDEWASAIEDVLRGGGWICNEYDSERHVSPEEFWALVRRKRDAPRCGTEGRGVTCIDGADFANYEFT